MVVQGPRQELGGRDERPHPPGLGWCTIPWHQLANDGDAGNHRLVQVHQIAAWTTRRDRTASTFSSVCGQHRLLRVPSIPKGVHRVWLSLLCLCSTSNAGHRLEPEPDRGHHRRKGRAMLAPEIYLARAFDSTGWRPTERLQNAKLRGRPVWRSWFIHINRQRGSKTLRRHRCSDALGNAADSGTVELV